MKTENNSRHIKTIAIISMVVTAIVAVAAIIFANRNNRFSDLEDLLDDDFFDDLPDIEEDEEDGLVKGTATNDFTEPEDKLSFCELHKIHCKCVQCTEKERNCTHCSSECKGPANAVSEHEDCAAARYIENNA